MFFLFLGFGLSIIGFVYLISYLNLLSIGYNFKEYVQFITRRVECYYSLIGIIIINLSIFLGGKNEKRI